MNLDRRTTLARAKQFALDLHREELAVKAFSKTDVEKCVVDLYTLQGRPKPQFVWLSNPWHLLYGPGVFSGYKRKQIRIDSFQEYITKDIRNQVLMQVGEQPLTEIDRVIVEDIRLRELAFISRLVETEIELIDRGLPTPKPALEQRKRITQSLSQLLEKLTLDQKSSIKVDLALIAKFGDNLSWFALEHYTNEEPPWAHIIPSKDMFGGGLDWAEEFGGPRAQPPPEDAKPPGMEWSHFLRAELAASVFFKDVVGIRLEPLQQESLTVLDNLSKTAHALACFPDICFLSEPPKELHRDSQNRFHRTDGPAIVYEGGFQIYSWQNTRCESAAIEGPANLETIGSERNVETMRILLERYGIEKYLEDTGAEHIHEDETGVLFGFGQNPRDRSFDMMVVAVTNSTPEADGTFKRYFLRVPPNMSSAREAVAWTFHMNESEYNPLVES